MSHDKRRTFTVILETLKDLDYNVHYEVLDGKHFVPQHRERILIVGFDNKVFNQEEHFSFPKMPEAIHVIEDILEPTGEAIAKYTLSDKLWEYLQKYAAETGNKGMALASSKWMV